MTDNATDSPDEKKGDKRVFTEEEKRIISQLARALQFAHSAKTTGQGRKWDQTTSDERKLWMQLSRRAMAKLDELRAAGPETADAGGEEN